MDHHHHGGCSHESSDSDYQKEIGIQYSLFKKIDLDNLECLNETDEGSARNVFKPYEQRLNFDKVRIASVLAIYRNHDFFFFNQSQVCCKRFRGGAFIQYPIHWQRQTKGHHNYWSER